MELVRATEENHAAIEELMHIFYSEKEHAGIMDLKTIPTAVKRATALACKGVYIFLLRSRKTGENAGYMLGTSLYSNEYGGFLFFLDEFMIHPKLRGCGAGTTALDALQKWARKNGFVGIALETTKTNAPARRFYARHGFVESERIHMLTLWAQESHADA